MAIARAAQHLGAEIRTEAPVEQILMQNGRATGVVLKNGKTKANPTFENRVIIVPTVSLSKATSFSFPLYYIATRFSRFIPGAENDNNWTDHVGLDCSLDHTLSSNLSLSLRFTSGNFLTKEDPGYLLGEPFETGSLQFAVGFSL